MELPRTKPTIGYVLFLYNTHTSAMEESVIIFKHIMNMFKNHIMKQ